MNVPHEILVAKHPWELLPNRCVLWSSGKVWHRVVAEACHFDGIETPQFRANDHCVLMHLSAPAFVELEIGDQSDRRARTAGDLAVIPASAVRQVRSPEPHDVLMVTVSLDVMAQTALESGDGTPLELLPRPYHRDAQLEHICWALKAEAESNYVSGPLYGESLALALCIHLLRQRAVEDPWMARKGGIAPRKLRQVVDYIESNLDSPMRMASLAEVSGLSHCRFAHNFKCATGVSPYQYVLRTRLERAKRMLRQTNLSVVDVAYSVGCQSVSRFNSLFRREVGTTPSGYRASFR